MAGTASRAARRTGCQHGRSMARVASFHLVRDDSAVTAMTPPGDRPAAAPAHARACASGACSGTGRGSDTGPSADLRRTALFAVWEDEGELDRFLGELLGRPALG